MCSKNLSCAKRICIISFLFFSRVSCFHKPKLQRIIIKIMLLISDLFYFKMDQFLRNYFERLWPEFGGLLSDGKNAFYFCLPLLYFYLQSKYMYTHINSPLLPFSKCILLRIYFP